MSANKELAGHNLRLERVWRKVLKRYGLTKAQVRAVVDAHRDELLADARQGSANWPHVGVFKISHHKSRDVANPVTGERMRLPRTWRLALRASKHQKGTGDGPA